MPSQELSITHHAIARYRERVMDLPDCEAEQAMRCPAAKLAARIGAPYVRLPGGQRLVLSGHTVVTVLPSDCWVCVLDRRRPH